MRPEHLEAWVLSLVDQIQNGAKVEDSRVELKADWPDPRTAARRIAGHANASGGDAVLWIIGLDEKRGVVPVTPTDIASWRTQVAAEFDGLDPSATDLAIPTAAGTLIALLFDTSRRPYVVKNPAHGTTGGGAVSLEVPWRAGTAIRSARREDLIRILVPLQTLPIVELLAASASTSRHEALSNAYAAQVLPIQRAEHIDWEIRLTLYVTPKTPELLVLPVHKASLTLRHGSEPSVMASKVRFRSPYRYAGIGGGSVSDSETISATSAEAVVTGPGKLFLEASYYDVVQPPVSHQVLELALTLTPAGQDRPVVIMGSLAPGEDKGDHNRSWVSELNLNSA